MVVNDGCKSSKGSSQDYGNPPPGGFTRFWQGRDSSCGVTKLAYHIVRRQTGNVQHFRPASNDSGHNTEIDRLSQGQGTKWLRLLFAR